MNDELDALLDLGDLLRQRGLAEFDARPGFVDQIDGLVGQETIWNEASGGVDRSFDRFVGISDGVEFLVALFDSEQNADGVRFVGRRNLYRLEAALERPILLDGLAILARRGGADALDLAAVCNSSMKMMAF
jgi:hypothetical protein